MNTLPFPALQVALASIQGVANTLTDEQKILLDALWNHLCDTGASFPKRKLLPALGVQPISAVMQGMASELIIEQFEAGEKHYSLTMWGALSSSQGSVMVELYVRLLDLIKALYLEDDGVSQIDSNLIRGKLAINQNESSQLGAFARIISLPEMPIHYAGHAANRSTWSLAIREDVVDLFQAKTTADYFFEKLSKGWRPIGASPTIASMIALHQPASWWAEPDTLGPAPNRSQGDFVASLRLETLRGIDHIEFDCTRLVCLCEELNTCAASGLVHAVILLTRAVLDHIPPIFGFTSFTEVASNYGGGGRSFKASAERLEKQARKVADRMLHQIIRNRELAPHMQEVDFSRELETVLAEACRLLKPLRSATIVSSTS